MASDVSSWGLGSGGRATPIVILSIAIFELEFKPVPNNLKMLYYIGILSPYLSSQQKAAFNERCLRSTRHKWDNWGHDTFPSIARWSVIFWVASFVWTRGLGQGCRATPILIFFAVCFQFEFRSVANTLKQLFYFGFLSPHLSPQHGTNWTSDQMRHFLE